MTTLTSANPPHLPKHPTMAKAQGLSKHTMASTKSPTRRMIDFLSLLILAVVLSLTYINISPSTHIPSSLHPKSLSSHTTTTKTTSTTTSTSSKPIPFPFGQNNFSPNFSSPTTHHPPHQKRLNPQQLYDNYRCYGEKLWDMTQQVYRGEVPVPGRTFTSADLAGAWSRVDDPGHFVPVFEAWSRDTFGRVIGGGEVSAITTNQNKGYVSTSGTQEVSSNFSLSSILIISISHIPLHMNWRHAERGSGGDGCNRTRQVPVTKPSTSPPPAPSSPSTSTAPST